MTIINLNNSFLQHPNQFVYFDNNSLVNFDLVYQQLAEQFNCTYISYALELSNRKRVHYYSDREWQKTFIDEKFIHHCPLLKFGRNAQVNMLNWNSLSGILNKQEKYVMDARKSFNIGNGIGAKNTVFGMQEIATFASTVDNVKFFNVFMSNINSFKAHLKSLRALAIASMIASGWIDLSHISFNLNNMIAQSPIYRTN